MQLRLRKIRPVDLRKPEAIRTAVQKSSLTNLEQQIVLFAFEALLSQRGAEREPREVEFDPAKTSDMLAGYSRLEVVRLLSRVFSGFRVGLGMPCGSFVVTFDPSVSRCREGRPDFRISVPEREILTPSCCV